MTRHSAFLFPVVLLTFLSACGGLKSVGAPIPTDAQTAKLEQVLASPSTFDKQLVVLEGVIAEQCGSLCDFILQNGAHKTTIFPEGIKFPKLPTGRTVRVYSRVTAGTGQVVISALGLEIVK